jgi:hypothetical protein
MFTVKHISIDGSENLIAAKDVRYDPGISASGTAPDQDGRPTAVYLDGAPYGGGTFFVMNASGKTVARYDLGASPVPHIGGIEEPKTWRGDLGAPTGILSGVSHGDKVRAA